MHELCGDRPERGIEPYSHEFGGVGTGPFRGYLAVGLSALQTTPAIALFVSGPWPAVPPGGQPSKSTTVRSGLCPTAIESGSEDSERLDATPNRATCWSWASR